MTAPSSPPTDQPDPAVDDERHPLGHLTGELDVSSAPYRARRAWGSISCWSVVAQPQRRRDDPQRRLQPFRRFELVLGLVEMESGAPRCVPDPAQEQSTSAAKSSAGVRNGIERLVLQPPAGDGGRRRVRPQLRQRGRHPVQHRADVVGRIVDREHRGDSERVGARRPAEVRERRGRQHRVRHDQQPAAGVDMRGAPVDFDDPATRRGRFDPVAELKRLLEQAPAGPR